MLALRQWARTRLSVGVFPEVDDCLREVLAQFCLIQHFGRYRHTRDQVRCNTGVVRDLLKGYQCPEPEIRRQSMNKGPRQLQRLGPVRLQRRMAARSVRAPTATSRSPRPSTSSTSQ